MVGNPNPWDLYGTFTYSCLIFMVNVGINIPYMDGMGNIPLFISFYK